MTRLSADDIKAIPSTIHDYDQLLMEITGASLKQIAAAAAGSGSELICPEQYRVAIIPVTTGFGKIEGFSEAVQAIANHLGFRASITQFPDVRGLAEAYSSSADIIMLADDHLFVAINPTSRAVIDNTEATAIGYTVALDYLVNGLAEKEVLLIGAGQLGRIAAQCLLEHEAHLTIHDLNKKQESSLVNEIKDKLGFSVNSGKAIYEILPRINVIFDASSGGGFITGNQVNEHTCVAAPGIPLGLDHEALNIVQQRLVHDPLQIGVAAMLYISLR
ncbi:MAG: 3-methylornithyl-N6-L-lysine dehydrogenase PylD [Bacillota bacterium]